MLLPIAEARGSNTLPLAAAAARDDGVDVGPNMSEPPLFPAEVVIDDGDDDEVIYLGTRGSSGAEGVTGIVEEGEVRAEPDRAEEAPVVSGGTVNLDGLLGIIARSHNTPLLAAPPSFPLLAVPPKLTRRERRRAASAALQAPPVLGKRQRSRSPSPELQLTEELFEEIGLVNGLFKDPCLGLIMAPAVFELLVAGQNAYRVKLSFSSGYPLEQPKLAAVETENGEEILALAQDILKRIQDGKPCLERLARGMAEALEDRIGEVPWTFKVHKVIPTNIIRGRWFPNVEELNMFMENLRAANLDYPPKFPVFEIKDGINTALISEKYALDKLKQEGQVIEGNERLEFLGDAVLNTLIASSMFRMYQVNEGGMTKLHDILRSNMLFSVFSRAYGLSHRLKQKNEVGGFGWTFKKEADIFEAVVGGLHLDSAAAPGGWITMQKWFDVLIEPWIDWTLSRLNVNAKSSMMTYNHIPLDRKPSNALVHASAGSRARSASPRRKIAPVGKNRRGKHAARQNQAVGGWPTAPQGMDIDAIDAGAEERRWARIQSLEQYQSFDIQRPGHCRPAPEHREDEPRGMHGPSHGLQLYNARSMALIGPMQDTHAAPVYPGNPAYSRDRTRLPDLRRPAGPEESVD